MDWKARWIWMEGDPNPWNYHLCARKSFDLDAAPTSAALHVTTSCRYVVWVNGVRLGQGPVRAFPWRWRYDTYDLSGRLKPGCNTVAVLAIHHGTGTFQTLPAPGAVLAQVEADGKVVAATDSSWEVRQHPAYSRSTPRITCQQGWVEEYDARIEPFEFWQTEGGNGWSKAIELGPAGIEPWKDIFPRDIPFLTEEPVYPVNVLRARMVHAPAYHWECNLRRNMLPGVLDQNHHPLTGFLVTSVQAESGTSVRLTTPCGGNYATPQLRVNGVDVPRTDRSCPPWDYGHSFEFTLRQGDNLLVFDITGEHHEWGAAFVVETTGKLTRKPVADGSVWATAGPFGSRDEEGFAAVWNATDLETLKAAAKSLKGIGPMDQCDHNPLYQAAFATETGKLDTRAYAGLVSQGEDVTVISPDSAGDAELLLDLGRMTVGYWEFELLDAPEGAQLDIVGFESIQDGVVDLTWGTNEWLRYTTRGGAQRFHSTVRRGGRYIILTARNLTAPLKLRWIRMSLNTYPNVERGDFRCSDGVLTHLWKMGAYTTRLCSEDTYVDCPTYEQTFWVGDSRNAGAVNHYAFGDFALTRRCLLLVGESLKCFAVAGSQVPSAWDEPLITWSLLWVFACEEFWQITGDRAFLEEIYPAVALQTQNLLKMRRDDGLIYTSGWNFLDWAGLDTPVGAACTYMQAWTAMVTDRQAVMAEAIGRSEDIPALKKARQELTDALNQHLWDPDRHAYVDCIHPGGSRSGTVSQQNNIVVLMSGCAPEERAAAIQPLVVSAPGGVVKVGSPYFMFFSFEQLAAQGRFQQILDMIRQYWNVMLVHGATTCWETFPGYNGGRLTRSHCHAWSAAPTYFLSRYQLGVSPLSPGYVQALIAPVPAGLQWAKGRVPTPCGEVEVSWQKGESADEFLLEAALPAGVSAEIRLPEEAASAAYIKADGAERATRADGRAVFHAAAGARVRIECGVQKA